MKRILFFCCLMGLVFSAHADVKSTFFKKADSFLEEHVNEEGMVAYKAIKGSPSDLNELVGLIEKFPVAQASSSEKKAFYINAYNLLVIDGIVANYPVKQPLDIDGFFDKKKKKVGGEQLTLNQIENEKLRAVYKDARIHFVLVCAAKGCPKLMDYAYKPTDVEKRLTERTRATLNDDYFIRVKPDDNTVLVSEIFKWYKEDFTTGGKSIVDYINKYRTRKVSTTYTQGYYPYVWKLNEQ